MDSLKFTDIKVLQVQRLNKTHTVSLVYNHSLPLIGLNKGIESIQMSSALNLRDWQ